MIRVRGEGKIRSKRGSKSDRNTFDERDVTVFADPPNRMDIHCDPYKLCEVLLMLVGQGPYQKPIDYIPRRAFILFVVVLFLLVQIRTLIVINMDIGDFLKNMQLLSVTFIGFCHLVTLYIKSDKYEILWSRMMIDSASSKDEGESEIREKYFKQSGILCLFHLVFLTGIIIIATIAMCMPVILDTLLPVNYTRPREILFILDLYINEDEYFYVYVIYYCASITVGIYVFIANVSMVTISINHACAMFHASGYQLERAFDIVIDCDTLKTSGLDREELTYKNVTFCVETHRNSMKFSNTLEDCLAPLVLQQFACLSVALSFSLVVIMDTNVNFANASFPVFGIIYICILMSFGQRLINISTEARIKAYAGRWYLSSVRTQKLLVMILRCCVPCSISAYRIVNFSLETAEMILKTAVSYCMILQKLR